MAAPEVDVKTAFRPNNSSSSSSSALLWQRPTTRDVIAFMIGGGCKGQALPQWYL